MKKEELENLTKEELENLRIELENEKTLLEFADYMWGKEKRRWQDIIEELDLIRNAMKKFKEPETSEWEHCGYMMKGRMAFAYLEEHKDEIKFEVNNSAFISIYRRRDR